VAPKELTERIEIPSHHSINQIEIIDFRLIVATHTQTSLPHYLL
jgi:hypothetical protein